jgi:hypothetical protein
MTIITTSTSQSTSSRTISASKPANGLDPASFMGMLSNIQDNLNEYQARVLEMEQELRTVQIENKLLRNHIRELMRTTK